MDIHELYNLYTQHPEITTDSRHCPEGSIFLALKGASFNGNAFAVQAIGSGCAFAIVDEEIPDVPENLRKHIIKVENCLQTFKDLAREHRRQFGIPVIGITGTNGKTTTKELISAVLGRKYNVLCTQGNFNNDVGVPKTLFRLDDTHEIAVVEMGASHPGDIRTLVETAEPTCGMVTNVGRAHLQGFGSFEGVCQTKGELYDYLKAHDALVFLNADNEHLTRMAAERNIGRTVCYGSTPDCSVWGHVTECAPYLTFCWQNSENARHEVRTKLIGAYNLDNMLAAIAIGLHFGVEPEKIDQALENYTPQNNRSQLDITPRNRLIVDAYNANPTSMEAAIRNFRLMDVSPKMAIIGQMGELGDVSDEEHRSVVAQLTAAGFGDVWLVGENYADIDCPFRKFRNVGEVKQAIGQSPVEGKYILIKGSNAVKLYELKEIL